MYYAGDSASCLSSELKQVGVRFSFSSTGLVCASDRPFSFWENRGGEYEPGFDMSENRMSSGDKKLSTAESGGGHVPAPNCIAVVENADPEGCARGRKMYSIVEAIGRYAMPPRK